MSYQMRNVLVTGGAGFIGINFIQYMLNNNSTNIINIDKLTYASNSNHLQSLELFPRYTFVKGDITNDQLLKQIFEHYDIDTVIHFAAESHVDKSIENSINFINTNILGTYTLLETARKYWFDKLKMTVKQAHESCRFHHVSTDEVYGSLSSEDPSFTEETAFSPSSPYSASKASSDHLVHAWFRTYKLPTTITNCSNNFGPYQHNEKFIPTVISHCINKTNIPIYGSGENIRDWLYVEDHCKAILDVIKMGDVGGKWNIGGKNEWKNIEIANLICNIFDKKFNSINPHCHLIKHIDDRAGHDFRYSINPQKIQEEIGWIPKDKSYFYKDLEKTVDWFLNNRF